MADKRIFISFAMEDKVLRDFLVGQKRNDKIDISFTDYSVKEPWSSSWKTNCRTRIKGCDGVIGIITKNTPAADGQLWSWKCGYEETIPILLIHGYSGTSDRLTTKPAEISGKTVKDWTVANISAFLRGSELAKAARLVGIDTYDAFSGLDGCEADAKALTELLSNNHDGSPNFSCRELLSSQGRVTRSVLRAHVNELFVKEGLDVALFYFAGHGVSTSAGSFLVTQDGARDDEGLQMAELIAKASASPAREKVIVLDCCHAGAIDQLFAGVSALALGKGVSVLAACRDSEFAAEHGGRGLFTKIVGDALDGGAADVRGHVSVAGTYAYLDEVLDVWEQRPVLKANVEKLVTLRQAEPSVSDDKLRKLPVYFPQEDYVFPLDERYEPTAEPNDPEREAIFADLQRFRGARLLVPIGTEHMYYAAMEKRSCRLTPLGRFYRRKAEKGLL